MIGLTEDQLYKLVWQLLVWLLGAFGVVATATWWAKGQLESSKINGLQAQIKNAADGKEISEQGLKHQIENLQTLNAIAEQRRQLAEDQLKASTKELERIKSEVPELKNASTQLMLGQTIADQKKSMDALESTLKTLEASINSALSANNQTGTILGKEGWEKPITYKEYRNLQESDPEGWQELQERTLQRKARREKFSSVKKSNE